ncbi:hypothetical protein ACFOY5_20830 [Massilia aurea]|uniref:hypothetical protein n=1 Tax=Massilia aurea TaxID=373040 RepID=UPI0021614743|nr:hypothetical protein [Massilia aurea]MCS0710008.1 hypothetical protein [Massilia aurea]
MFVLFLTLLLHSSPSPVLTSSSTEFTSEQSCNAAAARLAKELKSAYAEHLPRVTTVCVPK